MPRRVQDIIPADRRSIRSISRKEEPVRRTIERPKREALRENSREGSVSSHRRIRERAPSLTVREDEKEEVVEIDRPSSRRLNEEKSREPDIEIPIHRDEQPVLRMPVTPPSYSLPPRRRGRKWLIATLILIAIIGVAGYFASVNYSKASFTIIPKVIPVNINGTYVAQGAAQSSGLSYEVITVQASSTMSVAATNGPQTSTKATGKIVIYNYSNAQPVRLIAGTRFSNDIGNVYRLSSSLVVPAFTNPSGTVIPGKIAVSIVADQPGQNYNFTMAESPEMKIVAYKGSTKYDTIYAKPTTNIAGGFLGVKKIVSPTTLASSTASLKAKLTSNLLDNVKALIPAGYIMYDNGYATVFSTADVSGGSASTADISLHGTMYGIVFPKNRLTESFAGTQSTSLFGSFDYVPQGIEDVQVTITNLKDFSAQKKGSLVLKAKGNIKLVGTVPVEDIKKKLSGLTLASTQDIFKLYSPVIESGSGELAPPWAKIPADLSRITVEVQKAE